MSTAALFLPRQVQPPTQRAVRGYELELIYGGHMCGDGGAHYQPIEPCELATVFPGISCILLEFHDALTQTFHS